MSGAEHIDIASAQSSGLNECENATNVNVKESLPRENDPVCTSGGLREEAKDSGSLNFGDVGNCFREGLELILNEVKEPAILHNEVQTFDTFSMEIGSSNCRSAQQSDGLTPTNGVVEHDGEGPSCEITKDGTGTSTFGNVETTGHCSSPKEVHVDVSGSCYEALQDHKVESTCKNELNPVENSDFIVVEGQTLNIDSAADLMLAPTIGFAFCNESQTCEHLDVDKTTCQEPVKSEMPGANVILPDIIVGSELESEGLVIENNAADLLSELNLQTCELHKESQTCEPLALEKSTSQEHVKSEMSDANVILPDIIVGSELVSDGLVTENDHVDLPSELNLQNGSSEIDVAVEQKEDVASKAALASSVDNQDTESNLNHGAQKCLDEEAEKSHPGMSKDAEDCLNEQREPLAEEIMEKQYYVVLATPATYEMSRRGRRPGKFISSAEKKCTLRSSVDDTRASYSRSQDNIEASQPSTNLENSKGSTGRKRGRKKKTEIEGKPDDEFERMRKHLRYLLHRIRYAQNLLDAYSSEGWRGQSLEKLRPERELQRAKADITRSKLKIRDLFQRLDSISAQGKFPESLYDSDGLIDSEDIFCAKCGSKDLSTTNDIILCDGVCERGFHQYCLEPPLRTEEIPPGDEGWLCPACECKLECLGLLNDSQEIKLSIKDNWEKVFPETAVSTVGNKLDDIMGLPSDDSEDNDFNPDGSDDGDANDEGSASSSDESDSSDFSSASEDLGAITGNHQNLSLPSDDSEDDDYDPDVPNVNEDVKHETSSSGFTSASENLDPADDDGEISGNPASELPMSELDGDVGDIPAVSSRRHIERLDYKKLYDETYGNATSDSSDDEEWADVGTTRKERRSKKGGSVSSAADASVLADNGDSVGGTTPKKRGRKKKINPSVANDSSAQPTENCQKAGSGSKSSRRPPYNKLGETVVQRLYESFKENQYPDREMREKLANELGLTPDKVNKWFGHSRWTFNHHRDRIEGSMSRFFKSARNDTHNETKTTATDVATAGSGSGNPNLTKMDTKETDKQTSVSRRGRKRKKTEDDQPNVESSNLEIPIEGSTQEAQQGVEKRLNNIGAP